MFKRIAISTFGILMGALLVVGAIYGTRTAFASAQSRQPVVMAGEMDEGDFDLEEDYECDCPDWFVIAAEALSMDEDALWEAFEGGQTLAQIAAEQNVDPQTIIEAVIAAETTFTAEMVTAGEFSQEEADEWLAELPAEAQAFMDESIADWELWEGVDWFGTAATTLGLDEEALFEALDAGQTLTEIAAAQGVAVEDITAAILAAETAWLDEMIAAGELTQEDADEWLAEIPEETQYFLEESLDDWEMWEDEDDYGLDWYAVAAETLGVDEEALFTALDSGQSIAEFAQAQGADPQAVIDAIVAAEKDWVDEWLTELPAEAQSFVEESWDMEFDEEMPNP